MISSKRKIKLIAETAWHHEGDFHFMKSLLENLCSKSEADIIKIHLTLDLDEYMTKDHEAYPSLKKWMFSKSQWSQLISIIQDSNKEIMVLLNDLSAIEFAKKFNPNYIEIHSVAMNVPRIQKSILEQ